MRCIPLVLVLASAAAACHGAPPEQGPADAAAPSPPASAEVSTRFGGLDGGQVITAPREVDAGHSPTRDFCNDAYTADFDRLREKCAPEDLTVSQSLGRAAAGLCFSDMSAALARSRASFDQDAADHCVAMLRAKPLTRSSETDTLFQHFPCDRVLLGMQAEGQPCRFPVECKDGLACVGYAVGVDGTCKKPPATGQECSSQAFRTIVNDPAAALHHPACVRGDWCAGKTCEPRLAAGKACGLSAACAEGLACLAGKCAARAAVGGGCTKDGDCAFSLWCDRAGDAGAGKCAAKRAEGQPCGNSEACKGRCDLPKAGAPDAGPAGKAGKCVSVCGSG